MTTPATPENAPGPVLLPTPEVVQAQQLLARQQLAVAYLTDGPRIPDDLQLPKSHQLVSRAVSLQLPEEPSEDVMAGAFAGLYQQSTLRAG